MREPKLWVCPVCNYNPILRAIKNGFNTNKKISKKFKINRSNLSFQTKYLEKKGYLKIKRIKLHKNKQEGKTKIYTLTKKGTQNLLKFID